MKRTKEEIRKDLIVKIVEEIPDYYSQIKDEIKLDEYLKISKNRKQDNSLITIMCAYCRGTGEHPFYDDIFPICEGRATNEVPANYFKCPFCKKNPGVHIIKKTFCRKCHGTGMISLKRLEYEMDR